MQVADLYLGSAFTSIFYGDGLSTGCVGVFIHRYYLAVLFRRQYSLIVTLYVHPLVHLLFGRVCRVGTHTERRCNEQELFTFQRERVIMFRTVVIAGLQLWCSLPRFQPFGVHLFHYHTVITLEVVTLDNGYKRGRIFPGRGISGFVKTLCPSPVIVRIKFETGCVPGVFFQKSGVMGIGIAHTVVAAEFLIRLVIGIETVFATTGYPRLRCLDAEMVVLVLCETTLAACALKDALGECHRSRYAVQTHLLHRKFRIFLCVCLIFSCHSYILIPV